MYYSFFIPFSLLLTLVVQNVFVAIILNSFTKIHTESSHEHWKKDLTHVSYELYKRISLTFFIFRMRAVLFVARDDALLAVRVVTGFQTCVGELVQ